MDEIASTAIQRATRVAAQLVLAAAGLVLALAAFRMDGPWFERHVTAIHFWPAVPNPGSIRLLRFTLGAVGLVLLTTCSRLGRWIEHGSQRRAAALARLAVAVLCALVVSEGLLQFLAHRRPRRAHEILGVSHPRYGWTWRPLSLAILPIAGRNIRWAFNADGARVQEPGDQPDRTRPTLLFTGESFVAGQGLQYQETIPALVGERLRIQTVNLAVNGYGNDQAYLKLVDALPRFERVVAAITFFIPLQLSRNLQDDKPRLVLKSSESLELRPAASQWLAALRLRNILRNELPYSSERTVRESIALAAAILRETAKSTQAKGAAALFVVPSYGLPRDPEARPEHSLLQQLFDRQKLRYIVVDLEGEQVLPGDGHPSPAGARRIAEAIVEALRAP